MLKPGRKEFMYFGIPGSQNWEQVQAIHKGWSSDRKYKLLSEGSSCLLRLSAAEQYAAKQKEFLIIQKYAAEGIAMSQPLAFGRCEEGVYMLLSWVEGEELKTALPKLPQAEQYRLGRCAGELLRRLHHIPLAPEDVPEQSKHARQRAKLERYLACGRRAPNDAAAVSHVQKNLHKIWSLPPVYQHGDFHPGNMVLLPSGAPALIDFNRWEVSDPYEEFCRIELFTIEDSLPFSVGQIDGYFADAVPADFWEIQSVYAALNGLCSICWAIPYGEEEVQGMLRRFARSMTYYEGFTRRVPTWYEAYSANKK